MSLWDCRGIEDIPPELSAQSPLELLAFPTSLTPRTTGDGNRRLSARRQRQCKLENFVLFIRVSVRKNVLPLKVYGMYIDEINFQLLSGN